MSQQSRIIMLHLNLQKIVFPCDIISDIDQACKWAVL